MNEQELRQLVAELGLALNVVDRARELVDSTHRLRRGDSWYRLREAIAALDGYKVLAQLPDPRSTRRP